MKLSIRIQLSISLSVKRSERPCDARRFESKVEGQLQAINQLIIRYKLRNCSLSLLAQNE